MLNLSNNNINQILNNFKKISKLYIPLKETKTGKITIFSINLSEKIEIFTEEILTPPYYWKEPNELLSLIFNTPSLTKINIKIKDTVIELDRETISIIIGFLIDTKEPHMTFDKAMKLEKFHLAHYLSTVQKIEPFSIAEVYLELGFIQKAIETLKDLTDERSMILMSKIYRKTGELKKSLELLSNVKSKEFEVDKNLEYAWLHLLTQKHENAYKIFSYYSSTVNDLRLSDIHIGMAKSLLSDEKNILQAKDILDKITETELSNKTEALKILSNIYIEIKDFIKAKETLEKLLSFTISPEFIRQKSICEFNLSDDEQWLKDIFESAVFEPEKSISVLNELSSVERIKEIYPQNIVIKREEKKGNLIEAILTPEDISNTSNITKTRPHKPNMISTYEMSELKYEIKKEDGDEISNLAFSFSRMLEEEFNKKIYFNYDGIDDIERKIRITHMSEIRENEKNEILKHSSAFLLFFLKERFKAKIIKYSDMDIWSWPAIIKNKNDIELITYPAARAYMIEANVLPEQGWIRKYIEYINTFMNQKEEPPSGKEAVTKKIQSNEHKIFDAKIEHRKILLVSQDIEEASHIPHNSSAISKLDNEIKKRFKPQIPPTTQGWKLLRCYAHIFLEMIIKDFNPEWYNVEKNDGVWSFKISPDTFIFPIGKAYKAASGGESLLEYFEIISKNFRKR